jgi:carbamate kinase
MADPDPALSPALVVSLGGNAFARPGEAMTMAGQFEFAAQTLAPLAAMMAAGRPFLVTHGNGPQVGYILTRVEAALGKAYALPLEVCVAESEGEIGYVLQQTLHNLTRGQRPVTTLLTQVLVDADDPAFNDPSKPIGPWFEREQAAELKAAGMALVYDKGGRGRRIVPSPKPLAVVELDTIKQLLALGIIVIAGGGGGIPVIRSGDGLKGVEAVVDKDLVSSLLAVGIDAEQLILVTDVDGVYIDFDSPSARLLERTDPEQLALWLGAGQFPPGTMGPKVEAAIGFVQATGRRAVICQPRDLAAAIEGRAGTVVESGHVV